jgi:hypothetical protein
LEDIEIKVDVKIVSDHPYPWHSGVGNSIRRIYKTKIQTEVAELINQKVRRLKAK